MTEVQQATFWSLQHSTTQKSGIFPAAKSRLRKARRCHRTWVKHGPALGDCKTRMGWGPGPIGPDAQAPLTGCTDGLLTHWQCSLFRTHHGINAPPLLQMHSVQRSWTCLCVVPPPLYIYGTNWTMHMHHVSGSEPPQRGQAAVIMPSCCRVCINICLRWVVLQTQCWGPCEGCSVQQSPWPWEIPGDCGSTVLSILNKMQWTAGRLQVACM